MFFVAISASEEPSVFSEIWQYFYDTFINPSEYYEYLNLGGNGLMSVRMIIFGLCVGLAIAGFSAVFTKRVLGNVVRRVLSHEALSPDSAKTLEEMGLESSFVARMAVRKSVSVRRVVKCVEEENFIEAQNTARAEYAEKRQGNKKIPRFKESEYVINPYADKFYIPEKMKYTADIKFESKGTTWFGAVSLLIVMIVAFIAIMVALPYMLSLLNDVVGIFKN